MTVRSEHLRGRSMAIRLDLGRFLPALILGGYGIFIVSLLLRNVMTWYINPTYVVPTTIAGAVLIGLAAVRLGTRPVAADADECCADGACTDHSAPKLRTYVILSIPLLLALIFPPRGLAAFSANQRGVAVAGLTTIRGTTALHRVSLSVDTSTFSMQDWVGALSADPNPKDYLNKAIHLTGIVVHDPAGAPPGYIMVLRYQVTCCIADAQPEGLVVKDTSHGALKDNQWVTLVGKMGEANYQGQSLVVVLPSRMTVTKAGDPYMY